MIRLVLIIGFMSLAWWACDEEVLPPVSEAVYGYSYFPLKIGDEKIYRMDSIRYDLASANQPVADSVTFYMREHTLDTFSNLTGETLYRIERTRAPGPEGPWVPLDIVTRSRTTRQAYFQEGNLRYISLVFPLRSGIEWDGTAHIPDDLTIFVKGEALEAFKDWGSVLVSVDEALPWMPSDFDSVATVEQANSENLIEQRWSMERYAKGVGLIYREQQLVDSYCKYLGDNAPCVNKSWPEKAGRGYKLTQRIIDWN